MSDFIRQVARALDDPAARFAAGLCGYDAEFIPCLADAVEQLTVMCVHEHRFPVNLCDRHRNMFDALPHPIFCGSCHAAGEQQRMAVVLRGPVRAGNTGATIHPLGT